MSAGPNLCLGTSMPNDLFLKSKIGHRLRKNSDLAQDSCSTARIDWWPIAVRVKEQSLLCCCLGLRLYERPHCPTLGAVLVTWWDIHTDMRPRTFPTLPAISGETKGPGSPDVGRVPFAAPGTILPFTAWSGSQGQKQHQPELTL